MDTLVVIGGHVSRRVREGFAAYARTVGSTPAALIRMFAESVAGGASTPRPSGSVRKVTLALRDTVRRRLREEAEAHGSTPTAWATALLEVQLCGQLRWTDTQLRELRAVRMLLANLKDGMTDTDAAARTKEAMRLVEAAIAGNLAYWGATAPSASSGRTGASPEVVRGSGAADPGAQPRCATTSPGGA